MNMLGYHYYHISVIRENISISEHYIISLNIIYDAKQISLNRGEPGVALKSPSMHT